MLLRLPKNLHYPITVTKVLKLAGRTIARDDHLFLYSYNTTVTEGARDGEDREVKKTFIAQFQSSLDGTLRTWRVWEGDVLTHPVDVCEVEEDCPHTVQFLGMCTNCGKDMTIIQSYNSDSTDADRAPIRMTHDTQWLTISQDEANRVDEEAKRRLLAARKLSLVVDLDQTIIHAAVDPTIAEWQRDPNNPNYEAVKDVRAFQLIDDGPGMRGCWYYIKLRPGLLEFLDNISQIYELHIYTMGTRQYAQQIANIVDPSRRYFGERILSRDESGSMIAKNLERLFPVDTKMVVIIDDRGDVWKWSANLIRVTPFDFFVGIGDINSSFLPKRAEIKTTAKAESPETGDSVDDGGAAVGDATSANMPNGTEENGVASPASDTSALEQLVAMGGGDDPTIREIQSKGQEELITIQLEEKPLLRMQQEQDEKDDAEAAAAAAASAEGEALVHPGLSSINGDTQVSNATESDSSESSESASTTPSSTPRLKARHSILRDDDRELIYLESRLASVHAAFFAEYDRKRLSQKGGRVAALSGKRKMALDDDGDVSTPPDLLLVPDIKKVMPAMKLRVLAGVVIVFSGVLPLGTDIQSADISVWAKTFGATIVERVGRGVTHVTAARPGTAKVKQALKRTGIKVVSTAWLMNCIQQWRKVDEGPYLVDVPGRRNKNADISAAAEAEDVEAGKSEEPMEAGTGVDGPLSFLVSSEDEGDEPDEEMTGVESEDDAGGGRVGVGPPERKRLRLDIDGISKGQSTTNLDDLGIGAANRGNGEDGGGGEEIYDDQSPLTIDQDEWADMDAELKEFMGSDTESDSDAESVASGKSSLSLRLSSNKRKRDDLELDKRDVVGERPRKVLPPSLRGNTGLRHVASAGEEETAGLESVAVNGHGTTAGSDEDEGRVTVEQQGAEDDAHHQEDKQPQAEDERRGEEARRQDSDDELARELERELEDADDEEADDGGGGTGGSGEVFMGD